MKSIDSPPVINNFTLDGGSAVTSANIDASAGGNATIVINGSLFDTTASIVTFEGTGETLNTVSIVRNSSTQITVTVLGLDLIMQMNHIQLKLQMVQVYLLL